MKALLVCCAVVLMIGVACDEGKLPPPLPLPPFEKPPEPPSPDTRPEYVKEWERFFGWYGRCENGRGRELMLAKDVLFPDSNGIYLLNGRLVLREDTTTMYGRPFYKAYVVLPNGNEVWDVEADDGDGWKRQAFYELDSLVWEARRVKELRVEQERRQRERDIEEARRILVEAGQ